MRSSFEHIGQKYFHEDRNSFSVRISSITPKIFIGKKNIPKENLQRKRAHFFV
jgi:hypothetical protein